MAHHHGVARRHGRRLLPRGRGRRHLRRRLLRHRAARAPQRLDLLDENFPEAAKGSAIVVFEAHDGTTLDEHQDDVAAVLDDSSKALDHVESLTDPFAAGTISEDGRIGYAVHDARRA